MLISKCKSFIYNAHKEKTLTGFLLFFSTLLALFFCNSDFAHLYIHFIDYKLSFQVLGYKFKFSFHQLVNEFLMAIFFLFITLELKYDIINKDGCLNTVDKALLPAIGALGGVIFPALFYFLINYGKPETYIGWAIPTATDIAFSLGVLVLVGKNVPTFLRGFLVALAVVDDILAILIISTFYSHHMDINFLFLVLVICFLLFLLNYFNCKYQSLYLLLGMFLLFFISKAGVHTTIGGVICALFIPMSKKDSLLINYRTKTKTLYSKLYLFVNYIILPVFAFTNAGVSFIGLYFSTIFSSVSLGIIFGLFLGKQIGITFFCFLALYLNLCKLPKGISIFHIYALSLLCGIGFTMSLLLGEIAFADSGSKFYFIWLKSGVLLGSLLSAITGFVCLKMMFGKKDISH